MKVVGGPATIDVDVDGVGKFRIRKRTLRLGLRIEGQVYATFGGAIPGPESPIFGAAYDLAYLQVMVESAPAEFPSLDDIDPLDADSVMTVLKVAGACREAEARFRSGSQS